MNYVCDHRTKRVLHGPMTSNEAVKWICARGSLIQQAPYCNISRYGLAKLGIYPNTKQGNEQLERDLAATLEPTPLDAGEMEYLLRRHRQSVYENGERE